VPEFQGEGRRVSSIAGWRRLTPIAANWPLWLFAPFVLVAAPLSVRAIGPVDGEVAVTVAIVAYYAALFRRSGADLRRLMVIIVPISLAGEVLCSLILGLYRYRGDAIPPFVPLGHAVIFATGVYAARHPALAGRERLARGVLLASYVLAFAAAILWLGDTLSVVAGLLLILLLARKRWALLYLVMGIVVLGIEIAGTRAGVWAWQRESLGGLTATNPPIGAIVLYVFGDALITRAVRLLGRLGLAPCASSTSIPFAHPPTSQSVDHPSCR
jgi:hypothetical protein